MITPVQAWLARTILNSPNAKARGTAGEMLARELLLASGYFAGTTRKYGTGDILAFDHKAQRQFKIEVKVSRQGYQGDYKFCLRKEGKGGKTDFRKSDVLMLICVSKSGAFTVFCINTVNVGDVWSITLPGRLTGYAGKYRQYKQSNRKVTLPCDIVSNSAR